MSHIHISDTISYCGPMEYRGAVLSRVNFPGGYISGDSAYHYISDYQGNVRQVVNAASGHVAQENSYYPGGMLFGESTSSSFGKGSAANPYRFAGKEFITHAGLHLSLHDARMYDPALARFITPDPLAHRTPHLQQYLFCAANPVMYVDPTGEKPSIYEAALMASAVYQDKDNFEQRIKDLADKNWFISTIPTTIKKNHPAGTGIGMQSMLFERTTEGRTEYAYVYAGTNSWEDCVEDLTQLVGITQQYPIAIQNAKTLSSEIDGHELTFVGHSMGGAEAAAASIATGHDAITFNAAALSWLTQLSNGLNSKKSGNIVNCISATPDMWLGQQIIDPITILQSAINMWAHGTKIFIPVGFIPSHSIDNIVDALNPQ